MDHNEKIQNAVDNIISDIRSRGWKFTRTTKKALAEAEALGLTPYLGIYARQDVKGAEIVNAVIEAAKDAGGKRVTESGWTSGGDGDAYTTTTEPSALYLALNSTDEPEAVDQDNYMEIVLVPAQPTQWASTNEGGVKVYATRNEDGTWTVTDWMENQTAPTKEEAIEVMQECADLWRENS